MQARKWLRKLRTAWSEFSSEPFYHWLFRHLGFEHFAFSLSWITTPLGGILLISIVWALFGRAITNLVHAYKQMSLIVFVFVFAGIGAAFWYAVYRLPDKHVRSNLRARTTSAPAQAAPTVSPTPATPETEKSIAAVSPPIAAGRVKGQISWNFSSFLGMSSGSPTGAPDPQFIVQTFQAFGRNSWSSTITKITGYVEIDGTGERFPLLFNKEGTPVDLAQMPSIENDERINVVCFFTQDRSLWGSWQGGVETNSFLNHYTPFTFVVSINGGEESKYPFSTEDCRALIQSFKDGVLRRRN